MTERRGADTATPRSQQAVVLRSIFTNDVIRAMIALARQQQVCREQGGQPVFVTGMEAAREYVVEQVLSALPSDGELEAYCRWSAGEKFGCSCGIHDGPTYGYGALDKNGYFECDLPERFVEKIRVTQTTQESDMVPTVGRIVLYKLTEQDATEINRRRTTGADIATRIKEHVETARGAMVSQWPIGAQAHIGNSVSAGDVFPMLICRILDSTTETTVNGQVFLDGNDTYWATSRVCGEHAGSWQ